MTSALRQLQPGATVLIVDDTPATLRMLAEHLEQNGVTVVVAEDGEEALQRARFVRPALILMDVMMPVMNGIDACRRLKDDPATRDIPVIFMTSLSQSEHKVSGFEAGAVDYVTKPVQLDEVLARVRTHLLMRQLHTALEAQLRQAQKMDAFGQLAGGVAHDFNNLLGVIVGQADLASDPDCTPAERLESLREIRDAARRSSTLTRQILAFSRRQAVRPTHVDLNGLVTDLARMLRRLLGERITLAVEAAPAVMHVFVDIAMIEQVLINMAINARDAMGGSGTLTMRTRSERFERGRSRQAPFSGEVEPGSYVRLSVIDTGTGIAPEVQARIFEPFFTTKASGQGTGLGLATSLTIVQQNQGWIELETAPGAGSTFHIFLPLITHAEDDPLPMITPGKPLVRSIRGTETILLVEDDAAVRRSVRQMLERHGYKVVGAANGQEALQVWDAHPGEIALVLSDLITPGAISGRELAARLRAAHPTVRIGFISGYEAELVAIPAAQAGIPHLLKPFTAELLTHFVRACIDR